MEILAALKQEEAKLQHQLTGIRSAIAALGGNFSSVTASGGKGGRAKRVVSAALRAHLSKKAKERWAKIRADKKK
jgi:Mrp family chromosome partitioning ATPase